MKLLIGLIKRKATKQWASDSALCERHYFGLSVLVDKKSTLNTLRVLNGAANRT